ncbi:phosphate ABC transporter permease [Candidatus Falkowbacteria bacterium RBG_13_39_14]|uniref:Transport permease protein n=1 Tax=Candidatus Falkowbacteria bacterium RBG_13_39_14 TaxID=1797985 RepID=A0A1F5S4U2_9BACT|nr:MAG: phosphate ABC transporter permease [Candidatus Falkowbacteria bacterium RBG_13_39_14]
MKTIIIKPREKFSILSEIKEIFRFKDLFYFLSWRDIKVRYKQTSIGITWAIFQPFMTMVIFSIFFGNFAKMPSDGVPYPIFVYIGLLIWEFFSSALNNASGSMINNQSIVTKVYFPRLILPISSIITNFVDFLISSVVLVGLMIYYGYTPKLAGLTILPILLLITFMAAIGIGLFLSAINVKYRDVRYILPFFIQILMFLTPVIYPASIAGKYSKILALNPMTGVINAARAAILGTTPINWILLLISAIASFFFLIIGIIFFKRMERYFADVI